MTFIGQSYIDSEFRKIEMDSVIKFKVVREHDINAPHKKKCADTVVAEYGDHQDYKIISYPGKKVKAKLVAQTLNRLLVQSNNQQSSIINHQSDDDQPYLFQRALVKVNKLGRITHENTIYAVEPKLAGKEIIIMKKADLTLWAKLPEADTLYPMLQIKTTTQKR